MNGIMPGFIKTGQDRPARAGRGEEARNQAGGLRAEIERDIPMGRIGTTEELARAIVFLGSDLSSYISGASIPVDGAVLRSI